MLALLRPLIIAIAIIIALSLALGIIKYEHPAYGCFHGRQLRFAEKTKVLQLGNVNVYAYPLVSDCDEEDRYDPDLLYKCGYQEFCHKD